MKKMIFFSAIVLITDQFTKLLVDKFVDYASCINIIPFFNLFNITNIRNTGIVWGILKGKNLLFSFVIFSFLVIVSLWFHKNLTKMHKTQRYAFCLIISGGLGNLMDRLLYGGVVDFLDFGINHLRWPSFNIADSCICVAVILVFFVNILDFNKDIHS
ncbi:MAG: signal peptidase II [Endomicrobium sp.]|jgi:signal peptidase II|nr:signal peptidase II [Endomicrobium sp.]